MINVDGVALTGLYLINAIIIGRRAIALALCYNIAPFQGFNYAALCADVLLKWIPAYAGMTR